MGNKQIDEDFLAAQLQEAGYSGLFQFGEHSLVDSIWQDGKNQANLMKIVSQPKYDDYIRVLASEVLYEKTENFPPVDWADLLGYIYAQALAISGSQEGTFLSGNLWGFMFHSDQNDHNKYGTLGNHLMNIGQKSIPHLIPLLEKTEILYYEGSQDATLGNNLKFRVKDAAAYYIGKITGIPVRFFEDHADRDVEIQRLKVELK